MASGWFVPSAPRRAPEYSSRLFIAARGVLTLKAGVLEIGRKGVGEFAVTRASALVEVFEWALGESH
jgi:hypothetical protein